MTMDLFNCSRKRASLVNLFVISVLCMPAVLGYNVLSGVQPLGAGTTIMDLEDFIVSYNILPLGCLLFVLSVQERTAGDMTISWQKLIWEKAYHFLNG